MNGLFRAKSTAKVHPKENLEAVTRGGGGEKDSGNDTSSLFSTTDGHKTGRRGTRSIIDDPSHEKCFKLKLIQKQTRSLIVSPLFLRHRNPLLILVEVVFPGLVAFIIFAAFTSGLAWQRVEGERVENHGRLLRNYPEVTMPSAMAAFRSRYARTGRPLIFYTPETELTTLIMQYALDVLEVDRDTQMWKSGGKASSNYIGLYGVDSANELKANAVYHSGESPIGIIFEYEGSGNKELEKLPHRIQYSIRMFERSISQTADENPFILSSAKSDKWLSPYVESGFIGLQYAIDTAIIRVVMEREREKEAKSLRDQLKKFPKEARKRAGLNSEEDYKELDADLFSFLVDQTRQIEEEEREKTGNGGRSLEQQERMKNMPSLRLRTISTPSELPSRVLKPLPFYRSGSKHNRDLVIYAVAFTLVVAYAFMSYFIVRQIAEENASGIKDVLKMHGLKHLVYWELLFVHALVFRAITSAIVALALRIDIGGNGGIVRDSDWFFLYMIIYIHQLALTFMNYFFAIYMHSVNLCGWVAVASCIFSFYLPATFRGMDLIGSSDVIDVLLTLIFPNWCLRHILSCVIHREFDEKGMDWDNLMDQDHEESVSVGSGLIILTFSGLIYFLLSYYLDKYPDFFYRVCSSLKFCCCGCGRKKEQKRASKNRQEKLKKDLEMGGDFEKPAVYEEPDEDRSCYVQLREVSKSYGRHMVALDSISMNFMHQEINIILGHSGSGKSTLISILAGIVKPTHGQVKINGIDVHVDPESARSSIGYCPQKMVHFNLVTVQEHVFLCYRLRGYSKVDANRHVTTLLTRLKLWDSRKMLPGKLTNDGQRRLAMAMALADAPKVILLDEPTLGLDLMGRRDLWDIILTLKRFHTVIMTTNFMDEAEQLADRVVLLAHGRIVCCGSLHFLREKYDTGYFLKILPHPDAYSRVDQNAVLTVVKDHLGEDVQVKVRQQTRIKDLDSLVIELPSSELEKYADLCEDLERKKKTLNFWKYSIKLVSLNDIFIKVCHAVAAEGNAVDLYVRRNSVGDVKNVLTAELPEKTDKEKLVGSRKILKALLRKHWVELKGSYRSRFGYFLIPFLIIVIVVYQAKIFVMMTEESPPKPLDRPKSRNLEIYYRMGTDDSNINYGDHLASVLKPDGKKLPKTKRMMVELLDVLRAPNGHIGYEKDKHMLAFEFRKIGKRTLDLYDFVGYFASDSLHSAPIAMNMMTNVYLSAVSRSEGLPEGTVYKVKAINDPLPLPMATPFEGGCGLSCMLMALMMAFALALISFSSVQSLQLERTSGVKHLQIMTGVSPMMYWRASLIVDAILMFIVSLIIVFLFIIDYHQSFHSSPILLCLWLICMLYLMWSGVFYAYFVSCLLPKNASYFNYLTTLHFIFGVLPMISLSYWSEPQEPAAVLFRNLLLVLLPPYTITLTFYHFFNLAGKRNICKAIDEYVLDICSVNKELGTDYIRYMQHESEKEHLQNLVSQQNDLARCCDRICIPYDACYKPPSIFDSSKESWENPGIIFCILVLILQGFMFWGLLTVVDHQTIPRLRQKMVRRFLKDNEAKLKLPNTKKFRDVRHEWQLAHAILEDEAFPDDTALVCVDLTKSTTLKMVVKDFCIEVKKGQCVAIMGRVGSGRSSVVKMISGEMRPTYGNSYVAKDKNLVQNRTAYLSSIGYCPENMCLFPDFTGAQMMEMMGMLRGLPPQLLQNHVHKWLSVMGLWEVANEKCRHYGDGMSRRLCIAMAFIGQPDIVLLDEPTSGIDPVSRERIWGVIEFMNKRGHTIIFTTYSSEEAFQLGDKVAVISEGTTQCIGGPDQLMSLYENGHTITFRLKHKVLATHALQSALEARVAALKLHAQTLFKHVDLLDEHDELLMYFLRDTTMTWSQVYRKAHELALDHSEIVENFEVVEGSVDDIFVYLTNKYSRLDRPRSSSSSSGLIQWLSTSIRGDKSEQKK